MTETNERTAGAGGGQESHGRGREEAARDDEGELDAEEESARAMEAEVPHPPGYPEPGQEQPS